MREKKTNKNLRIVFAALAILALVAACSKRGNDDLSEETRQSFDAWVKKYAPNAIAHDEVYIEYIERGTGKATPVLEYTYIKWDYTGRMLDGTVFVTRDEEVSRRAVSPFLYTTHYADDFTSFSVYNYRLCEGLRRALQVLTPGDSVRVYVPADLGYGTSIDINSGYLGETDSYSGMPFMMDIRLKEVVTEPFIWERDNLQRLATERWGNDYINDTVGAFIHILERNPLGDTITQDSSVYVYYEQYFLDGFLAVTNVEEVARTFNVYDASNLVLYDSIVILPSAGASNDNQKILYLTVPFMRKGEVAEVYTMSTWVRGNAGNESQKPEILPYQSMYYRIRVCEKGTGTDDE